MLMSRIRPESFWPSWPWQCTGLRHFQHVSPQFGFYLLSYRPGLRIIVMLLHTYLYYIQYMPACLPLSMMTGWRQSHHPISLIMLFASGFVLTVSSVWAVALWIELTPRMMMVMVMAKVIRQRPPPGPLWRSSI